MTPTTRTLRRRLSVAVAAYLEARTDAGDVVRYQAPGHESCASSACEVCRAWGAMLSAHWMLRARLRRRKR